MDAEPLVAPGGCIGIVGGGQLGRMTALAAAALGYRCRVLDRDPLAPAKQVAAHDTADYDDMAALERFAAKVDVVTCEFENVPVAALEALALWKPVRPGPRAFAIAQDRLPEKDFAREVGFATPPYRAIAAESDFDGAAYPAILKTRRLGYDGKGQARIASAEEGRAAWTRLGRVPCLLEGLVDFEREVSAIIARAADGALRAFDVVENRHRQGILDLTIAPAPIAPARAAEAQRLAGAAAQRLGLVGLLAVEMFVDRQGRLLFNEMAPRPHNSGHWTIEGCTASQFEQLVRAVVGLPLADPARRANAVMKNLIGDEVRAWSRLAADPALKLHLYGKAEIRAGRKLGHVTRLYPLDVTPDPRSAFP
ncbi:MAG: 5-(carboxyamino)imidazole ribonucleotide synthase [Alphaproteobacteria bacterium]|nr:5-(carboxyamino)imidazole ribonucleotide synthase [Alphaproteobacteria bacterium]